VNGVAKATLPIDGGGNFAGSVSLGKQLTLSDLTLTNPNLRITTCGGKSTNVLVGNGKSAADVTNVITVDIVGASKPLSASATVLHAVKVTRFKVTWADCPPLNKNETLNSTLAAGQSVKAGTVDCGVNDPNGFIAACSVTVNVTTSAGVLSSDATWTFNVSSCP
jgi:hypothetical protein